MISLILAAALTPSVEVIRIEPRSFDESRVTAAYSRSFDADGTLHLKGYYRRGPRTPFHFIVKEGRVSGTIGRDRYSFEVSER